MSAYFDAFEVSARRLAVLRVLFFGLLAFDLWTIFLPHAPRFGAGGFNVSQVPALDAWLPLPTPSVVGALYIVGGLAAFCAALGVGVRLALPVVAACYSGVYFWSQSDSYQHHYLVSLLLVLLCFVPHGAWRGDAAHVRSWAMRLVYVQVSLMYAWTAATKCDAAWLDGSTMNSLLSCEARLHVQAFGNALGWSEAGALRAVSASIMLGEFAAAALVLYAPWWTIGLFVIPFFHAGVEYLDFDIELFSYYMFVLLFALLLPQRWLDRGWDAVAQRLGGPREHVLRALNGDSVPPGVSTPWLIAGATALAAFALLRALPVDRADIGAGLAAAFALGVLAPWNRGAGSVRTSSAIALIAGSGLCLAGLARSEALYDYHRQWGGYLRRSGDVEGAIARYESANAIQHDAPARHVALARLQLKRGEAAAAALNVDEALRRDEAAVSQANAHARSASAGAQDHLELGRAHVRLADTLKFATEVFPAAGRSDDVAALQRKREGHLGDARSAFEANVRSDPACGAGRGELARLRGAGDGADR